MPSTAKYCFLFLSILLALVAGGQPVLTNPGSESLVSPQQLQWHIDESGNAPFTAIRQQAFDTFPAKRLLTPKTTWSVWTQCRFQNTSGADREMILLVPKSGYARLFVQRGDSFLQSQTGSLLPLSQRALPASANGFPLLLHNGETVTAWLQLQSRYSIYLPRSYNLRLVPASLYAFHDNERMLWQGIFLGVILIMFFYNLFTGLAVKDVNYLYYVLSIAGIGSYFAFYYGFGIEYLWPSAPVWDTFCYLLIVPFNGITRLLFTRTYLHTPRTLPFVNSVMNALLLFNGLLFTAGLYAFVSQKDIIYPLLDIIGLTNTVIHCIMLVAGIVAYYSVHYRPARFFIWANVVLVIGAVLFIGRELGLLPDTFFTRYLVQIGFLIQVVVFSLGLASRLNTMRTQLAGEAIARQQLLLEKEREKKELIERQRLELEQQVARQTADLKEKNSELKKTIALVKHSEQKLGQLNQVKDKLFSVISHDLRNPLVTMQSFLKLITEHHHRLTEEEKENLFVQAQQSLDHLNELMYNLLQWSRSQMNLLDFRPEKLAVRPLLQQAARVLQLHAHMKNITIQIEAGEDLYGFADRDMTEFVVRNLLSNAIKFSHRNKEVEVRSYLDEVGLVIEVSDRGIGMPETKIRKLLESHSTVTRRGTEKEKGTGIGLLICKEFIEKNRGRLSISSEPGKGSTFRFNLPVFANATAPALSLA